MNPVHLQQFLPNLYNRTSVNQLFQAQLASSKRMEIWQTLRFTNKLWNEQNFEYGYSAKLFTICMKVNRSIRTSGLWVTEVVTYIRTTPLLLLLIGAVADLGKGPGPHGILTEKKIKQWKNPEGRKAGRASDIRKSILFQHCSWTFSRLVAKKFALGILYYF